LAGAFLCALCVACRFVFFAIRFFFIGLWAGAGAAVSGVGAAAGAAGAGAGAVVWASTGAAASAATMKVDAKSFFMEVVLFEAGKSRECPTPGARFATPNLNLT
jgi:hypothetical protein